jgi:hypothetical protein
LAFSSHAKRRHACGEAAILLGLYRRGIGGPLGKIINPGASQRKVIETREIRSVWVLKPLAEVINDPVDDATKSQVV